MEVFYDFMKVIICGLISLELGGITSWYSHVYAWHYTADLIGP